MKSVPVLISLLLLSACAQENTNASSEAVQPDGPAYTPTLPTEANIFELVGAWVDDSAGNTQFRETWMQKGTDLLNGFGYVLSGEDTVAIEELKIKAINGEYIYSARIDSQNNGEWVDFLLMASGPDTLRFYNPKHDYPQEILYSKTDVHWTVRLSNDAGREKVLQLRPDPSKLPA